MGKVKKIKIKTNKAASKRFQLKKRSPIKTFAFPTDIFKKDCSDICEDGATPEVKDSEKFSFIFVKRSPYTLTRTVAGLRHQRRRRSARSLRRDGYCLACPSDLKRKYPLYIKKRK